MDAGHQQEEGGRTRACERACAARRLDWVTGVIGELDSNVETLATAHSAQLDAERDFERKLEEAKKSVEVRFSDHGA